MDTSKSNRGKSDILKSPFLSALLRVMYYSDDRQCIGMSGGKTEGNCAKKRDLLCISLEEVMMIFNCAKK